MNALFATRPVSIADGAAIVGVAALFLLVIEAEKLLRGRLRLEQAEGR